MPTLKELNELKNKMKQGVSRKSSLSITEPTDDDMVAINKFSLRELKKEEVFILSIDACDNETDDRNYEPFNSKSISNMKDLYIGKTMIKNHNSRDVDGQIARVFASEIVDGGKKTGAGEDLKILRLKAYMLKLDSNKDLRAEIEAGIKKEVSTNCRAEKLICSVCGCDNMVAYCRHWWGKVYNTEDGEKVCTFTIDGVKDVYEISLVAVPAQKRAGVIGVGDSSEGQDDDDESSTKTSEDSAKGTNNEEDLKAEVDLRVKAIDAFLFCAKIQEGEKNHE